jgi:predicted DNA-binding antitoxin AbrB/MazE fold protein
MTLTIEAIHEDGVFKPAQPLPLKEQDRVQVTVTQRMVVVSLAGAVDLSWPGDSPRFYLKP